MYCNTLAEFRDGLHQCFKRAGDALMDTADALLTETAAQSLPELSLSPCFRRQWHSLYEAFADAKIDRAQLQRLFAAFAPKPPLGQRLVLGVDASSIARPQSKTGEDRTYVHASNLPHDCKPVVAGWQFSALCVLPDTPSSWTYALDTQRIESQATAAEVAARQLKAVLGRLALAQQGALLTGGPPLLVADGSYGTVSFLALTQALPCDKLLRFAKNRRLFRPALPRPDKPGPGAPKKDGTVFLGKDAATHGEPDAAWEGPDASGQTVMVACWQNLHFKSARQITVSVLRVTRYGAADTKRDPRVSWFVFAGQQLPPLEQIPTVYARRYSLEHGFRVDKQDLLWEQVRLRTPEAFGHWTDIVACVRNQLCLARDFAAARQSWERSDRPPTPSQVRRAMGPIIRQLGTPAPAPQVRGNAPGRQKGAKNKKATTFKTVFKGKKTLTR